MDFIPKRPAVSTRHEAIFWAGPLITTGASDDFIDFQRQA